MQPPTSTQKPPRWKRWLRAGIWGAGATAALVGAATLWVMTTCFATPPTLAQQPPILSAEITETPDGRRHLGQSWFSQRPGRSILDLRGDPFEIGFANAKLTAELLAEQERALIDTVESLLSNPVALYGAA